MNERRDDTTEPRSGSRRGPERAPGGYYYDDATGYEPYDPQTDDEDDGEATDTEGGRAG